MGSSGAQVLIHIDIYKTVLLLQLEAEIVPILPIILSAAMIDSKISHREVNKLYIEKVAHSDVKSANSKQIG